MILNYSELLICIQRIEKQIFSFKLKQRNFIEVLNFTKTRQVYVQQQLLELQILNYITYYEEKIKSNHLETKIYSTKLNDLKETYKSKTNASEFLYCLKELATAYQELLNDLKLFYQLNRLEDVNIIKEKIENHTFVMEEIFLELSRIMLLSNPTIDNNQAEDYNSFVLFFHKQYTSKIQQLEKELNSKQITSHSFKILLDFRKAKLIRREVKNIQAQLEVYYINKNNLKFIDQVKWEYVII